MHSMALAQASNDMKRTMSLVDSDSDSRSVDEEDNLSTDFGSTSGSGESSKRSDDSVNLEEQLTEKKSVAVNRLRGCVILALILASVGVSVTVFILSRRADTEAFEIQFDGNAEKILEAFDGIFVKMGAISGLGAAATAHSEDHYSAWPYQTLSHFEGRGGNAREMSRALYIALDHIVTEKKLPGWEEYVLTDDANEWIDRGYEFQERLGVDDFEDPDIIDHFRLTDNKVDPVHIFDNATGLMSTDIGEGPYLITWESSPVLKNDRLNADRFHEDAFASVAQQAIREESAVLSGLVYAPPGTSSSHHYWTSFFATLRSIREEKPTIYVGDPMAYLALPVFNTFDIEKRQVVAVMEAVIHWKEYFKDILPPYVEGITVVLENGCTGSFTYEIQGQQVFGVGKGDLHEREFQKYGHYGTVDLELMDDGMGSEIPWSLDKCPYSISVYPSAKYYSYFVTGESVNVTFAVGMVFFYSILLFIFYDRLVESRQRIILAKATKSTAIVASLFPKNVRDRLLKVEPQKKASMFPSIAPNQRVKTYLDGGITGVNEADSQPIADLFPNCTVLFADIAGFTAWSSTREPAQVFLLLQNVYQAFDVIAKRQRVFKVETIGDSYLAVTGLPDPQHKHALIMSKFAWECLVRLGDVLKELEVSLGPDTADLGMRFGLHSGPVTAGVLKGDRARFQLFGDTVNTAARMESTGAKNRIQISSSTAELLQNAGKQHWVKAREDGVHAKGKGVLNTFWLRPTSKGGAGSASGCSSSEGEVVQLPNESTHNESSKLLKQNRLVGWMTELLLGDIKKILAVRKSLNATKKSKTGSEDVTYAPPDGVICLDELQKAVNMHEFNAQAANAVQNSSNVQVEEHVVNALRQYISLIASSYKGNSFHNFEHACHVTMSVHKLLTRIVAPDLTRGGGGDNDPDGHMQKDGHELAKELNDYSHGIVHDPLALFAITFSAMIHDVDHQGISNVQLCKEHPELAIQYREKSVAEQNSLDVAWDILMMEEFKELRQCIFETKEELMRFRQLIVNVVLATDIFDKELNDLRKTRWGQAFSNDSAADEDVKNDLRAIVVIEHIIQASDVSHTMQHWHVYQKWNERLFQEMTAAYRAGRMGADPSTFWYQGELGFFDNYVIPLAKKLKECNVFGVSSDEYLNYALNNREEWEDRGEEIVQQLIAKAAACSG